MHAYSVLVLSCEGNGPCEGLTPLQKIPTDYVKDQETEKAAKAQQRAVEALTDT
jgi:hypothetical protein